METKGKDDPAFQFMMAKVVEVEDVQGTFTRETRKITNAVRKALEPYVPELRDIDILGTFDLVKDRTEVTFKVGAKVSEQAPDGKISESLWVFHFNQTGITKVETLRVKRGGDGLFVPATGVERNEMPNKPSEATSQ